MRQTKKKNPKAKCVRLSSYLDVALLAVCLLARESHLQTAPPPQTIRDGTSGCFRTVYSAYH